MIREVPPLKISPTIGSGSEKIRFKVQQTQKCFSTMAG